MIARSIALLRPWLAGWSALFFAPSILSGVALGYDARSGIERLEEE